MTTRIPLAPGTLLGARYQIAGLAGEGGMGDVYEAFDLSLERRVALKQIRGSSEDSARERFRREALALAQLNHPGICQVFELAETSHGTFIAMEWIEGETLHARLRRGTLTWRESAEILRQTAEALTAAHAKGLVHRDLKPGNLMLTPEGRVKVLDFGLVRFATPGEPPAPSPEEPPTLAGDPGEAQTYGAPLSGSGSGRALTRIGSFMGTLGYTSPEQALARPVTPASDVFNLGILAQEMLTNRRVFPGEGRDALDAVVDNQREPFPRGLAPKAYRALVDRLLSPKPKDRPTTEEAARAFQQLTAPHGALWWSGLSAAAVVLVGGTGLWLYSRGVIAGLVKGRPARLAVMGFKNGTGVPMLEAQTRLGLADLIASRLRTEQKLQIIGSDALLQAARALKLDPATATPEDQLRLAKALGADLIVSGEVDRLDGKDRLRYALRDRKGRIRAQGQAESNRLSETMLDAIPLAQSTAHALQKAVDPFAKDARPEPYTITPEAFAAYAQGMEAYRYGHYKDAEPLLRQVAYAVPEWAEAVSAYSFTESKLAKPETNACIRWALVAARKSEDARDESSMIQLLAFQAWRDKDFNTAEGFFKSALDESNQRKDMDGRAFSLNGLGLVSESLGRNDEASQWYQDALATTEQSGDLVARGQTLTNLGNLALVKGDLPTAAQRYQLVVESAQQAGSETNESLGLNNLGIVLLSEFKPQEARLALYRSLALRTKSGDAYGVVSTLRNLGLVARMEGKDQEAEKCFQQSLDAAISIAFPHGQAWAAFYLGESHRNAGDLRGALNDYASALEYSTQSHNQQVDGQARAAKAECLLRLHQRAAGQSLLADASALIPGNSCLLRAQAWSAFLAGDRPAAQRLLDQAILDPKHDAPELRPELERLRSRFVLP
ncbi:MAG: tetratricopeptide repeat protein [Acidobacteria bacterium]|nr:tetratricopeptide repeat protein [Acidobacteriota bacterium]